MKMEGQIRLVNIENIIPNRFQPRLQFDEEAINELAESIREHGIIQPLVLRQVGDKFEIIAGERRCKASVVAGLTQVPAIICNLDDNESAEVAIIENTHRRPLSAIEEAKSFKKLLDRKYVTQDQLAKRLGTSQSNIANKIRLLSLDENVQDALLKDLISERHARSLLRVTDKFKQVELLNKIINEKLSVRQLDEEIDTIVGSYSKGTAGAGAINASGKYDINISDEINNSVDILADDYVPVNYQYQGRVNDDKEKKRDTLFFNKLENEAVNMDPSYTFGFSPFKNDVSTNTERDYDLLELEDEDGDGIPDVLENNNTQPQEVVTNEDGTQTVVQTEIQKVVVEKEYHNQDEVIQGIKKLIKNAKENEVILEAEEFGFDGYYQFVVRVFDDEKKD